MREKRSIGIASRASLMTGLVVVALLSVATSPILASSRSEAAREVLEDSFRTLPIEEGWLLQPLDEALGIRTIEVTPDRLVIDGQRISSDELEARLGDLAPPILELRAALNDSEPSGEESWELEVEARADAESSDDDSHAAKVLRKVRHRAHRDRSDSQVVVGSDLTVEEDEVYRDIVVFGGRLTVAGQVIGDAVAIGGSAEVSGEITGDLAVVGGSIELAEGARVMGDVVSVGGSVQRADAVEVAGQVIEVPFGPSFNFGNFRKSWGDWDWDWDRQVDLSDEAKKWSRHARWFGLFEVGWELIGLLFLALLACLVFLVARNPVERIARKVSDEPWKSGLVGLLTQILCVPVLVLVFVVLLISIIGIPLLLLLPFAVLGLVVVAFLGFTSVAYRIGSWTQERFGWSFESSYVTLLLGVGLIEVLSLIGEVLSLGPGPIKFFAAMFILFGCLVSYLAWTIGLGGAVLTRFGTWGGPTDPAYSSPVAPPPTPPLPPAPDWEEPPASNDGSERF